MFGENMDKTWMITFLVHPV